MDVSEIQQGSPKLASHRWLRDRREGTARVIIDTRCGSPRGLIQQDLTDGRRGFGYDDVTTMSFQPSLCWQLQLNSRWQAAAQSFFPEISGSDIRFSFSGVDPHDPKICKTNDDLNLRSVTDVLNLFSRDLIIKDVLLMKVLVRFTDIK